MQSNFRTLIFYIIILTLVFLPLKIVLAGQDDSGLKVVTIEGKDLIGEAIDNMYHPTDFYACDTCENFVTDGLNLIPVNIEAYEYNLVDSNFTFDYDINTGARFGALQYSTTTSVQIYEDTTNTCRDIQVLPTKSTFGFFTFKDLYSGVLRDWIVTPYYIKIYAGSTFITQIANPITSYVANPSKCCSDIWSGRLFISDGYYLLYSSASDKSDFTVSSTAGGVIRTPDSSSIKFLYSTIQGLMVGTESGIWILSGADTPDSWTFQQMQKIRTMTGFRTSGTKFIFMTDDWDFYVVDGINIQLIGNLYNIYLKYENYEIGTGSRPTPIGAEIFLNKYLFIPFYGNKVSGKGFIFSILLDLETKKYIRLSAITGLKNSKYYSLYTLGYQFTYSANQIFNGGFYSRTNNGTFPNSFEGNLVVKNISLDGNTAVRKNITRIEIDIPYHPTSTTLNTSEVYLAIGSTARTFNITDAETYPKTLVANMNVTGNAFTMQLKSESAFIRRIRIYYREIGNNKKDGTL